ncbi:MAG: V-type ATP synthase subunit E [Clostridiales bacterium]|jgi:V/A-type H+-transporting ATPase subunit E|nr:V-type ATP synthase subunit E [Clostridiales bacterium]
MTGLDKIIDEIITEARREAAGILDEARAEADEIEKQATAQAAAQARAAEAETDKRIVDLTAGRETSYVLRRRQALLEARQAVLEETLTAGRQALIDLPDNEYFAFILKLAAAQAASGEGVLLFNAGDRARMPKNFQHLLNLALPEGKTLVVSDAPVRIDGGFILKYGELEENCSFAAIFRDRRDEFIDLIRGLIFEG